MIAPGVKIALAETASYWWARNFAAAILTHSQRLSVALDASKIYIERQGCTPAEALNAAFNSWKARAV